MKTINLELSKRLAPYLEGVETEKCYSILTSGNVVCSEIQYKSNYPTENSGTYNGFKTFTLEEAIKFIIEKGNRLGIIMYEYPKIKGVSKNIINPFDVISYISDIKNIEKMLTYLLDNNLLLNEYLYLTKKLGN